MAARATAAKPRLPTPAIPASPPVLVSMPLSGGGTSDCRGLWASEVPAPGPTVPRNNLWGDGVLVSRGGIMFLIFNCVPEGELDKPRGEPLYPMGDPPRLCTGNGGG